MTAKATSAASDVVIDRAIAFGGLDHTVEHISSGGMPVGPFGIIARTTEAGGGHRRPVVDDVESNSF